MPTHSVALAILGIELSASWMCAHPDVELELLSPFGHSARIQLVGTSKKYHLV